MGEATTRLIKARLKELKKSRGQVLDQWHYERKRVAEWQEKLNSHSRAIRELETDLERLGNE